MIVLYDMLAFGTQPLTGGWVDRSGVCSWQLKLAVALLTGGALVSTFHISPTILTAAASAILLGMGNSLFHVYGGKYVAVAFRHDIRAMGVFVSTGAVGLAVGIGYSSLMLLSVFIIAFLSLSFLHLHLSYRADVIGWKIAEPDCMESLQTSDGHHHSIPVLYLSCLMMVVSGRAFLGESVPMLRTGIPSMSAPMMMVLISIVVMVGKMMGGYLSKWFGVRNVLIASLLLSGTVFLMCPWHDGFVPTTLFLINLSMPCTLFLATKALSGREGMAFGLLAMALLPGFMLGSLPRTMPPASICSCHWWVPSSLRACCCSACRNAGGMYSQLR